jgi:hypothetical protein
MQRSAPSIREGLPGIAKHHAKRHAAPVGRYTTPWSIMESATFKKPAMLAPLT